MDYYQPSNPELTVSIKCKNNTKCILYLPGVSVNL